MAAVLVRADGVVIIYAHLLRRGVAIGGVADRIDRWSARSSPQSGEDDLSFGVGIERGQGGALDFDAAVLRLGSDDVLSFAATVSRRRAVVDDVVLRRSPREVDYVIDSGRRAGRSARRKEVGRCFRAGAVDWNDRIRDTRNPAAMDVFGNDPEVVGRARRQSEDVRFQITTGIGWGAVERSSERCVVNDCIG